MTGMQVGKMWFSKTISFDEAIDKIQDEKRQREDIECPIKHMRLGLNGDNAIVVEYVDGREFVPTEHALKQMATWCDVSHAFLKQYTNPVLKQNGQVRYQRDLQDAEILLTVFKNGLRDGRVDPDKEFKFRTYTDGTLRAMLSDRYAYIDNTWMLESLRDMFKEIGGDEPRLTHWRGNADTLYGNLLIPDSIRSVEDDSEYGGMITLSNCEIGKRRLGMQLGIFRMICTNGMIGWDRKDSLSKVHRGAIDLGDLQRRIAEKVDNTIPLISAAIDATLAAKERKLSEGVKLGRLIAAIAKEHQLTTGMNGQAAQIVNEFNAHESGHRNMFGLVQAITRASQNFDPESAYKMDLIGGKLLEMNDRQWTHLNDVARNISDDVYNKVYGIATAV